jgi:hypothetical protein
MKRAFITQAQRWAWLLCLLLTLPGEAEQFVELTAEIEVNDWDYWFFSDSIDRNHGTEYTPSIFPKSVTVRCIVGINTWLMEGDFSMNAKVTWWFTGTNLIGHSVITKQLADPPRIPNFLVMIRPPVGEQSTHVYESSDGNPGRPVRISDLMLLRERICWRAFCSGSALRQEGRKIYPPSDLWKETRLTSSEWSDETTCFEDGLHLPKRLTLLAHNSQPIFQYQVRQSTNVLGWNFPTEFYMVQYVAHDTSQWNLHLTAKGKLTAIGVGTTPQIPAGLEKAARK